MTRVTIHIPCSREYKDEYKRILEVKYGLGTADRLMAMDARSVLEEKYPTLRAIAIKSKASGKSA